MFSSLTSLTVLVIAALGVPEPAEDAVQDVDRAIAAWLQQPERNNHELADSLVALGRDATPYLCELLDARTGKTPLEPLADAIGRVGHARAPATLGRLCGSEVVSERLAAVDALGALEVREAYRYLVRALEDPDNSVGLRAEATLLAEVHPSQWVALAAKEHLRYAQNKLPLARMLGRKGGDDAHEVLVDLTLGWQEESQLAGLQGLCLDPREEDGPIVAVLLREYAPTAVQKQACVVLGKIEHREATRHLINLLHMEDAGLVANAHWALQRITRLKLKADPGLWEEWWERTGKRGDWARQQDAPR